MDRNEVLRRYCGHAKTMASWILSHATESELAELDAAAASSRPGGEVRRVVDGIMARVRAENLKASDARTGDE